VIEVRSLVKCFGARRVLDGLSLRVEPGQPVVLIGANGAGKTTLMRILATLMRPTSGSIWVGGLNVCSAGRQVRRIVGFLSHQPLLYEDLTAEENLRLYARLYGLADERGRVGALLERAGLAAWRAERVRVFSRGMQQRLALARLFLHRPHVLLLDEPHSGLDAPGLELLEGLLREAAGAGDTILMATHDDVRARAVGWRVQRLAGGRCMPAADVAVDGACGQGAHGG